MRQRLRSPRAGLPADFQEMPYQVNDRPFEGRIVYDDSVQRKRPVVFMQPDWKGVCADLVAQARSVAAKDYVVLMAEMFRAGYGGTPKTREQPAAGMKAVHNDLAFTLTCGEKPSDHAERGRRNFRLTFHLAPPAAR
jgi:dienelactone hydrolase